jgi:hypothetical protein
MKLVDGSETVAIVVAADLDADAPDRRAAVGLLEEIGRRGAGHPYRRGVLMSDLAWFETPLFHAAPTIAVGGPGVNGVSAKFGQELPTVWTADDRALIQAEFRENAPRATVWGMDREATAASVEAFIHRGWLDEFLDRCWRFRAGTFA